MKILVLWNVRHGKISQHTSIFNSTTVRTTNLHSIIKIKYQEQQIN